MARAYYSAAIPDFLNASDNVILGQLARAQGTVDEQQTRAWLEEIRILRSSLDGLSGQVYLEFSIPRMGKRVDAVVLYNGVVFPLEFKVFSRAYDSSAIDQVVDYALDLKNFHELSHDRPILPVLVATQAPCYINSINSAADKVFWPLRANEATLPHLLKEAGTAAASSPLEADRWENSGYKPTPTIIEAAQALYRGHGVAEISRSDSGAINLSRTAAAILRIIETSRSRRQKSICFITGVPGAGKTLAGLNLANSWHDPEKGEHAVFLSGNGPLVEVLREALVRDELSVGGNSRHLRRSEIQPRVNAFIQNIHHFRDDALENNQPPVEHVVIFDEAQRAWTMAQTEDFMRRKKGRPDFSMSEPEFLISCMNRHADWATIVCLVGGGQEINTGEAGLPEWFASLKRSFPDWHIYLPPDLRDIEYTRGGPLFSVEDLPNLHAGESDLHLAVSLRSYRSEKVSAFVKALLDRDIDKARILYNEIKDNYPLVVTRDLSVARQWLRMKARGTERYGLVASSEAMRLRPFGINVRAAIDPSNWFLNGKDDIRSSYFLEEVATEFDIQGLELDWTCLAWDGDFYHDGSVWRYRSFSGTRWHGIHKDDNRLYRMNAYRVLLTRARQGMVIYVPEGASEDSTRLPEFYDGTYAYLKSIGIAEM